MPPLKCKLRAIAVFAVLAALASGVAGSAAFAHSDHIISDREAALAAQQSPEWSAGGTASANTNSGIPSDEGQWGPLITWPHVPVSAALIPDGRVLTWSSSERDDFPANNPEYTYTAVWDPVASTFTEIPHTSHDMFCAHQVILEDGRIFVNGGRNHVRTTSLFVPQTNSWQVIDDMHRGRWYPSSVPLSDGRVFTALGTGGQKYPEIWREGAGWRHLTGIDFTTPVLGFTQHYELNWWPFFVQTPLGDLFHFGPTPTMHRIEVDGNGSIQSLGALNTVPGWYPKHAIEVVYEPGKMLVAGGAAGPDHPTLPDLSSVNNAMTIDFSGFAPVVTQIAPMAHPRKFHNGVLLPNGEIFIVGGNTSGVKFDDSTSILESEIWNPVTGTFRAVADTSVPRNYHSIALLLLDGRVLSGGGGLCGACATNHSDAQVYSPPYLFNPNGSAATRPVITQAPATAEIGGAISVDADPGLARFTLIKVSTTTHAMNADQRFLEVPFAEMSPGTYQLDLEDNEYVFPPGHYMLYALDAFGVPSVAHVMHVDVPELDPSVPTYRYFKIESYSEVNNDEIASIAELDLLDHDGAILPRGGWALSTDSEELVAEYAPVENIRDGDPLSYWHTQYQGGEPPHPHWVIVDLGTPEALTGFVYTPHDVQWGRIEDWAAFLSTDGINWGNPIAQGTFPNSAAIQTVEWGLPGSSDGLAYEYFEGSWTQLPDFALETPISSGQVTNVDLSPRTTNTGFGFRFSGNLSLPVGGIYTFFLNSSDGSELRLDDVAIVTHDGEHAPSELSGSATLAAGVHTLEIDYFANTPATPVLQVSMQGPGLAKQSLPNFLLNDEPVALEVGANLAFGQLAGQSSTDGGSPGLAVDGNTDGNLAGGSVSQTLSENQPYWEIDLGDASEIDSVRIYNRSDCCASALANFHLFVSDDPFTSTDLATTQAQPGVLDLHHPGAVGTDVLMLVRRSGRHLRIQLEGTDALALAEVEVYLGVPPPPDPLQASALPTAPTELGSPSFFDASWSGGTNPTIVWNFGDGTPETTPSTDTSVSHSYAEPGRYLVSATVSEAGGAQVSLDLVQYVHRPLAAGVPAQSASIAYVERAGGDVVVNTNPDNDSLSVFDTATHAKLAEVAVGDSPRALASAPDGRIWVTNKEDATLSVVDLDAGGGPAVVQTIALPPASRPHGIVFSVDGLTAWIALEALGQIVAVDTATGLQTASLEVGLQVRHLSRSSDGATLYAPRFVSPPLPQEDSLEPLTEFAGQFFGGEVLVIAAPSLTLSNVIVLRHNDTVDAANQARGIPNYLGSAALSPDALSAWIPSKQDNIKRGTLREGVPLTHDSAVRAISSHVDLLLGDEATADRIDHDDSGVASAAVFGPNGNLLYVALEASRQVAVVDVFAAEEIERFAVGRAPQGLALSPDGLTLYVHNFMDRSVSVHDLSAMVIDGSAEVPQTDLLASVASESLAADVLVGKQFFYDALDTRLSLQSYLSCASCHNEGGQDGRVWDFGGFGEGLRNTIDLRGHGRPQHGASHWSANFDEIHDFEGQIRAFSLGSGLMDDADFNSGTRSQPLGDPKAGLSADLDALAAYVNSLVDYGESPYRNADGSLDPLAATGAGLFGPKGCAACHSGSEFTDAALHDVGTLYPTSGNRLGGPLPGIETPGLKGAWGTAPYLHLGRALTIEAAITEHADGASLSAGEVDALAAYVRALDDRDVPPVPWRVGSVTLAQPNASSWQSVSFDTPLPEAPIVVIGPATNGDSEPAGTRIRNVTAAGFELQIDEWDYQDGAHGTETVSYFAVVRGRYLFGGVAVEAGEVPSSNWWTRHFFGSPFGGIPVVLTQLASDNESEAAAIRLRFITGTYFRAVLDEEEAKLRPTVHAPEALHYIAFSQGTGSLGGRLLTVGSSALQSWTSMTPVAFGADHGSPEILAELQTARSRDPITLRRQNLSGTGVDLSLQEETSRDAELVHTREVMGWVAIGSAP